jgi:DNA-binding winged helix-turn-helix (wHTH) protein
MKIDPELPWPLETRYLRIGDLHVDLRYRRVVCPDSDVELQQRIFDLLLLFIAAPDSLHSRAELFQRLWPDVIVEDANLSQSIWLLRKALGEERKHWIRTVAKGGYVFEPPEPVAALTELPPAATAPQETTSAVSVMGADDADRDSATIAPGALPPSAIASGQEHLTVAPAPVGETRRRWVWLRGWRGRSAAVAAVAALAIWLLSPWDDDSRHEAAAPTPALAVALIDVEDPASAMGWPVKLLHDWLRWKLDSLPEVALLSEADLATYTGSTPPRVVFLASATAPDDPEQIVLHARFEEDSQVQRIELRGSASQVPAMADELSRQLMARLAPDRADSWPALELDARAARRYADVVEAFDHRDWMTTAKVATEVITLAPRFGLARLRLAQAQTRLAQASAAIEQMDAALGLLQPLPDEAAELLEAQRLEVDPQRKQEAAEAFGALAARHPGKTEYTLTHANLLAQSGQLQQALQTLQAHDWEREPTGKRISHRLGLAEIHRMFGDPEQARQNARAAERLAVAAGGGWELERGTAMLMTALADTQQYRERAGTALYEEAAKQIEAAGNHTGALYARFLAETAAPPDDQTAPRLEAMLAQARAGGYLKLEIVILMRVAAQHYAAGDLATYRKLMKQALLVARTSGDVLASNELGMAVVAENFLSARFTAVDEHLRQLRETEMQGAIGLLVERTTAAMEALRGDYSRSVETFDRADRELAETMPGDSITESQARLSCARAASRLPLGDLAGARADWTRCATSSGPTTQMLATLGHAETELLAGNRVGAGRLLQRAQEIGRTLSDGPDRWTSTIQLAGLLTRAGDVAGSDRLYRQALARLRGTGYDLLTAAIDIGLAENAAARGEWATSRHHAAAARRVLSQDLWALTSRLDLLDIAAALAAGDRQLATSLAAQAHAHAHRFGDVAIQMQIHSLLPQQFIGDDCGPAHSDELAAHSGMRGATLEWTKVPPYREKAQAVAQEQPQ